MSELLNNLFQITVALIALCLMTIPTGLLIIRLLNLMNWKSWSALPIAALIGLLILPFFYNLIGAVISPLTMPLRGILWVILNGSLWIYPYPPPLSPYTEKGESPSSLAGRDLGWGGVLPIALLAALITLLPLLLHNIQIDGNWYHVMAGDWVKHIGVGNALSADEHLPPKNPFLSTEPKLRYYYFAYILPGMITNISDHQISVTSSLTAFSVLIAFAFPYLLYGYAREMGVTHPLFSVFLIILVSGLDFIYVLWEHEKTGFWVEHIDFWANHDLRRINSISAMFIWTPQHVMGLVGFVLALWLIHKLQQVQNFSEKITHTVMLSAVMAAICGTSSFVWFGVMVSLGIYIGIESIILLYKERQLPAIFKNPLIFLGIALIFSVILSLPYLSVVGGREESAFAIKISPTVTGWQYGGIFSDFFGSSNITYILDFPFQMLVEFGAVMLLGIIGLWKMRHNSLWLTMIIVFFLIVLMVRPDRPDSNNYAARVAPMAWILLGFYSGYVQKKYLYMIAVPLMIIGLLSTFYEPYIEQGSNYQRLAGQNPSIQRNNYVSASQHELYVWLNDHLEPHETYQIGWESGKATYFVERRSAISEGYLALLYVSDDTLFYVDALASIEMGFNATDAAQAAYALHSIKIDYFVLQSDQKFASMNDPNFERYFVLSFENEDYRVYRIEENP